MHAQHDELHASIDAHLRRQRQVRAMLRRHEEHILGLWRERVDVPHCRYCGKPIIAGDDVFDVETMRAARACVDHFAPF